MYANFFGLRELPFNNTPDPRFFLSTPDHEEAVASLIYAVKERKGFVLLTGEVGAGKTLVSRLMLRHFGTTIAFATINHAVSGARDLLEAVCGEFEIDIPERASNNQIVRALHDYLLVKFSQDVPVVLVLDEAQNLPVEAFEQLRTIGNLEADDAKLLQIAIVGQPELREKFASPALRQLRQRVFRSFHLPALDRTMTESYIRHRLDVAGGEGVEVFTKDAIEAIWRRSRGLPRIINALCDNAMLSAYSSDERSIDGKMIDAVIEQMMPEDAAETSAEVAGGFRQPAAARHVPSAGRSAAEEVRERVQQLSHSAGLVPASAGERRSSARLTPTHAAFPSSPVVAPVEASSVSPARLQAIEHALKSSPATVVEARTAQASLDPMLRQARSLLHRMTSAADELRHREGEVRRACDHAGRLVRTMQSLGGKYEQTAERAARVDMKASGASSRLAEQTQRAQELADRLSRMCASLAGGRVREGGANGSTSRAAVVEASADRAAVVTRTSTAEALAELRHLARGDGVGSKVAARD